MSKPCCVRLGNQSWCHLPDGHAGDHAGGAPSFGPLEARPAFWRQRSRGMSGHEESARHFVVEPSPAAKPVIEVVDLGLECLW